MSIRNTLFLCACLLGAVACGDDSSMAFDGGNDDTGVDAPPECTTDRMCDDGLFCNGVESCEAGSCVSGDTILCDDGIECTIDLCDDELDACVAAAPDVDGDGSRDAACLDGDGAPLGADCDDADPLRFPGTPAVCDLEGHDEDCAWDTIGPADLSQNLGITGTPDQAKVLDEKRNLVLEAANKHGKTCAMLCANAEQARQWKEAGALILAYASEVDVLHDAFSDAMKRIKG